MSGHWDDTLPKSRFYHQGGPPVSKWSDEQAVAAYCQVAGYDYETERIDAGRAILDLRERAEGAEAACLRHEDTITKLQQRCAALEAALKYYADGEPCCHTSEACTHERCEFPACAAKQFPKWDNGSVAMKALSGDTSALREKLLQMGGLTWALAAPSVEVDSAAIEDGAKRVMEGR